MSAEIRSIDDQLRLIALVKKRQEAVKQAVCYIFEKTVQSNEVNFLRIELSL